MGNVVIIDDDPVMRELLVTHCRLQNLAVTAAGTLDEGMRQIASMQADLVFLDVRLPDGNGLDMLPQIQALPCSPEVIIITGMGDANGAELAITNGAWDYLQKPISRQEIILHIRRALEYHSKKMHRAAQVSLKRDEIIGKSRAIQECLDQVAHCAGTDTSVLITGETGTGKEVFARVIHTNSTRAKGPFVVVDCASLPDQLLESILFGHTKGSFTGATADRKGLVEQANGGTLFLDEAGELPLEAQKNFLRVLQERCFRPVGSDREQSSNFRLIAATNRDLPAMIQDGRFRSDLYFRLNTFHIHLPPLRDREKDIDKLAVNSVYSVCRKNKLPIKGILPETLEMLAHYPWPGNIRELENVLEKVVISDPDNPMIYPIHLPAEIRLHHIRTLTMQKKEENPLQPDTSPTPPHLILQEQEKELPSLKEYRQMLYADIEKHYLEKLLHAAKGDIGKACTIAGVGRSRLYGLLKEHAIATPDSDQTT